jgi:hypothetical protein
VISAEAEVHPAGAGDHGKTGSESAIAGVALGNEPKAACRTLSSAAQPEVIGHGAGINADFTLGHDLEIVPDIAHPVPVIEPILVHADRKRAFGIVLVAVPLKTIVEIRFKAAIVVVLKRND